METVNQTENVESTEDKAMEEAMSQQAEKAQEHVERNDRKPLIPLAFVTFIGAHPEKYKEQTRPGSLATPAQASRHPDVVQLQRDVPALSLQAATRIAWLLWRARQVEFWTMDLKRDRVISVEGGAPVVKRGTPTHTWEECLDAAYLGANSDLHNLAMERRKAYYDAQNKEREELESIALTIGAQPGTPEEKAAEHAGRQADLVAREPIKRSRRNQNA